MSRSENYDVGTSCQCMSVSSVQINEPDPHAVGLGEVAFAASGVPVSYIDSSMTEPLREFMQYSDSPIIVSLLPESQTATTTHMCLEMEDLRLAIRLQTGDRKHVASLIQTISRDKLVFSGSRSIGDRIQKNFGVRLENVACSGSTEQSSSTDVESSVQQWLMKTDTFFFALSTLRQLDVQHPCLLIPGWEPAGVALKDALPRMDLTAKIGVWFDIVFAIDYLHSHGISCGGVNTHTVFVDQDLHARVSCNNVRQSEFTRDFVSDLAQLTLLHKAVLFYDLSESDSRFTDSLLPCTSRKIRLQNDNAKCCLSQDFVKAAIAACGSRSVLIDRFGSRIEKFVQDGGSVATPKNVQVCANKLDEIVAQREEISPLGWRLFMAIAATQPITAIKFVEDTNDESKYPDNHNLRERMIPFLEGIVVDVIKIKKTIRTEAILAIKAFLEKRDTGLSWYAFGKLLKRENKDDDAIMAFRRSCNRQYWPAFIELGKVYRKKKQPEKALQCFRRVLDVIKGDVMTYHGVSLYEIARTHIEHDVHEKKALKCLQKSFSLGCFKGIQILCDTVLRDSDLSDQTVNDMIDYLSSIDDPEYPACYRYLIQFLQKRNTPSDRERAQAVSQLLNKIERFGKACKTFRWHSCGEDNFTAKCV